MPGRTDARRDGPRFRVRLAALMGAAFAAAIGLLVTTAWTATGRADSTASQSETLVPAPAPDAEARSAERAGRLFAVSCAQCHLRPETGAPQAGVAEDWRGRAELGLDSLLRNTVDGIRDMPPLGLCPACERYDFERLIRLMVPFEALGADGEARPGGDS